MTVKILEGRVWLAAVPQRLILAAALVAGFAAHAQGGSAYFSPGNLVVSRTLYDNNSNNIQVGQPLPPNCAVPASCVSAINDGTYPFVFNNTVVDPSFGVTAKIFLDQITTTGSSVNSLEVPNSSQ